jgi:hypothetical protein
MALSVVAKQPMQAQVEQLYKKSIVFTISTPN